MIGKFLAWLYEPIRQGNEYRAELYGEESQKYIKPERQVGYPVFSNEDWVENQEKIKSKFGVIRGLTGARFMDIENPNFDERNGDPKSICFFCNATGTWKAWDKNPTL